MARSRARPPGTISRRSSASSALLLADAVTASERDPRANQKQRTRAAIVEAAGRLLRRGGTPTVAEAAEEAKVSRATAYRYFPTPEDLLLEVAAVTPAMAPV